MQDAAFVVKRRMPAGAWETFDLIAHPAQLERALASMTDVAFLTDQREGIGTVFTCTRHLGEETEHQWIEVAEYEPDHLVRYIAEADDNLWDMTFSVEKAETGVDVTLTLSSRAARAGLGTAKGVSHAVRAAFEQDMTALSAFLSKGD